MPNRFRWLILLGVVFTLVIPGLARAQVPAQPRSTMTESELADFIDNRLEVQWQANKISPAPLAGDAEFLRRLHLDLAGRIPRVADARSFLDEPKNANRRKLVEKLLKSPQYIDHFTNVWRALMIPDKSDLRSIQYANNFESWLKDKVRNNTPYDAMVRELLTAPVATRDPRQPFNQSAASALAFYQANELKAENLAAATSRIFLGVRLECAQCHNHPFADWSRDQFWEYTAFFGGTGNNRMVRQGPNVSVNLPTMKIPNTRREVNARFLDGKVPQWNKPRDSRVVLAEWVTSRSNPYFAKTAANRIWGHFFGVGLIDPVDDEPTEERPVSHPVLLQELAWQFAAHKYDVKYLIRAITLSKAYQRSSVQTHPSQEDPRLFGRMVVRGMTAEQFFESLAQATGYRDLSAMPASPFGAGRNTPRAKFLAKFSSIDRATERKTSILQALALMNGEFVADATSVDRSKTLAAVANAPFLDTKQRIETLYLATLTRYPRPEELSRMTAYVTSGGPRGSRQAALTDVYWALLNSSEFFLNH